MGFNAECMGSLFESLQIEKGEKKLRKISNNYVH